MSGGTTAPELTFDKTHLGRVVPVLASGRTYLDEKLEVAVERVVVSPGQDAGRRLREPSLTSGDILDSPNTAHRWARGLTTVAVGEITITAAEIYERIISQVGSGGANTEDSAIFTGY